MPFYDLECDNVVFGVWTPNRKLSFSCNTQSSANQISHVAAKIG